VEQRSEVGQALVDEPAVRPQEPRELHRRVVHAELPALSDQVLGERDERALAQVVGAPP